MNSSYKLSKSHRNPSSSFGSSRLYFFQVLWFGGEWATNCFFAHVLLERVCIILYSRILGFQSNGVFFFFFTLVIDLKLNLSLKNVSICVNTILNYFIKTEVIWAYLYKLKIVINLRNNSSFLNIYMCVWFCHGNGTCDAFSFIVTPSLSQPDFLA